MPRHRSALLAVALALAAVVVMTAHFVWQDRQRTTARMEALAADMAKVVEAHVLHTTKGADIALRQAAAVVDEAGSLEAVRSSVHWRRLRDALANLDGGETLGLFDAKGNAVVGTGRQQERPINIADRPYFQAVMAGADLVVSPALRSRLDNRIIFVITRPIRDWTGEIIGVANTGMKTEWLVNFYALMSFGLDTTVTIFRTDGEIVARSPDLASHLGKNNRNGPLFQEQLPRSPVGVYRSQAELDGKERIAAYRLVSDLNLVVYAGIESGSAYAAWQARSLWFIAEVALTTTLVLLLLLWGTRMSRREHNVQIRALEAESVALQLGAELHQARRDPLTGLPARGLFLELAERMHQSAGRRELTLAFLYIDLDGFKGVNDRHGHHQGDKVLAMVAEIMRRTTRDGDLLGRLGGDEFVICLSGHAPDIRTVATSVAARIITDVRDLGQGVGCSIGIALCAGDCDDLPGSLRRADAAMYRAKQMGKGAWFIHETAQGPSLSRNDRIVA
ncbi:sensor domain-containing diguanylate cyclase [Azospirillum sp. BE72]|uniref:GGDEF domain-containing protein n=1 Tax=Azospirillum sp. BE72 TaxID=2817776 RepID=UPI002859087E|nr:sensor domain-containing diguanylate cyclase [Azospirillum sp. BE72]MDR6775719.1 diguanylate cyclase (GGDEF)-like protein [Azospirillum sp. BE72]